MQIMCCTQFKTFYSLLKSIEIRFQGSKYNLKPIQLNKFNIENHSFSQRAAVAVRKIGEQNWNHTLNSWFGLFEDVIVIRSNIFLT